MPYLKHDIKSFTGTIYGLMGEAVDIVKDNGNVLIVADQDGNRFTVTPDQLSEQPVINAEAKEEVRTDKTTGRKQKKAAPINKQSNLF